MDVLGAFFQLGERGQSVARLAVAWIGHLDEDRPISLHNKRIGRIIVHSFDCLRPVAARRFGRGAKWQSIASATGVQGEVLLAHKPDVVK